MILSMYNIDWSSYAEELNFQESENRFGSWSLDFVHSEIMRNFRAQTNQNWLIVYVYGIS